MERLRKSGRAVVVWGTFLALVFFATGPVSGGQGNGGAGNGSGNDGAPAVNFVDEDGDGVCDNEPAGAQGAGQGNGGEGNQYRNGGQGNGGQGGNGPGAGGPGDGGSNGDGDGDCPYLDDTEAPAIGGESELDAEGNGQGPGAPRGHGLVCKDRDQDGTCDQFTDEDGDGICDFFMDVDRDGRCDAFVGVDTDNDGFTNGMETRILGTDPSDPNDPDPADPDYADHDGDGAPSIIDADDTNPDVDGDGIKDGCELVRGSDPGNPADRGSMGDVTGDGRCDNLDAIMLFNHALGTVKDLECPENGDAQGDGQLNNLDALILFNWGLGNQPTLPL